MENFGNIVTVCFVFRGAEKNAEGWVPGNENRGEGRDGLGKGQVHGFSIAHGLMKISVLQHLLNNSDSN